MNQRSPSAVRRLKRAQTRIAASAEMRAGTHMHRHAVYKQERFDGPLLIFPDLQHLQVNVWRASAGRSGQGGSGESNHRWLYMIVDQSRDPRLGGSKLPKRYRQAFGRLPDL